MIVSISSPAYCQLLEGNNGVCCVHPQIASTHTVPGISEIIVSTDPCKEKCQLLLKEDAVGLSTHFHCAGILWD